MRIAAVVLMVAGLAGLYGAARRQETPRVRIADIQPTMNFALVRVAGTVSGDSRVFKEADRVRSVRFTLAEGSDELAVVAHPPLAEQMVAENRLPRLGDTVDLTGTLTVTEDRAQLRLQALDLQETPVRQLPRTAIGDLAAMPAGTPVLVEAEITRVDTPAADEKRPWRLLLKDASGQIELSFWDDVANAIADREKITPGNPVRVQATTDEYRDRKHLRLNRGQDLVFVEPAGADGARLARTVEIVTLGEISAAMAGREVETEGQVVAMEAPPAGTTAPFDLRLEDGPGQLTAVCWAEVAAFLSERGVQPGCRVQVRGVLEEYRGRVQLKINRASQVKLLRAADAVPETVPADRMVPAADITADMTGSVCAVAGRLGAPRSIRSGVIFPLKDKSGSIDLLIWDQLVPGEFRDTLEDGIKVTVIGRVILYKDRLHIAPASPQAIRMTEPAPPVRRTVSGAAAAAPDAGGAPP